MGNGLSMVWAGQASQARLGWAMLWAGLGQALAWAGLWSGLGLAWALGFVRSGYHKMSILQYVFTIFPDSDERRVLVL